MKSFLFCIANILVGILCGQTELQKLEHYQNDLIILSKKQAAYNGEILVSSKTVTFFEPSISSEEAKLVEEKINNYKKKSNQVFITDNDELNSIVLPVRSEKIPLTEFSSFSINMQKYITSKREFYESYIKFD